jgi:hypothetical protein
MVDFGSANLPEHGLKCGEISVNVVERGEPHNRYSS